MSRSETQGELYLYMLYGDIDMYIARIQYSMDAVRNYIAYSRETSCLATMEYIAMERGISARSIDKACWSKELISLGAMEIHREA